MEVVKLNWLYIDINSYFATIEQQINPSIRNKPVIVVPILADSTCAISASYEARNLGIKTGTKVYDARKLCSKLICIPARHEIYLEYHHKIFSEIDKYLHVDHIFSIDEGACRLTGEFCSEEKAIRIALNIKQAIRERVGDYIKCSIGIAPNKYLAKIATNMQKPDGLVLIKPEDIPNKLYSIPLSNISGIGRKTLSKFNAFGILTTEQLYQVEAKLLRKIWGSIVGEKVWYLLRGFDLSPDPKKSQSISHSRVLPPEMREVSKAREIAQSLLLKAAVRLRDKNLYTDNIFLCIKTMGGKYIKNRMKVRICSDSSSLLAVLLKNWDHMVKSYEITHIKKISLCFSNIIHEPKQLSFDDLKANQNNTLKNQLLSKSIDKLNAKFGKGTVSLGHIPDKQMQKSIIAFGYVPKGTD